MLAARRAAAHRAEITCVCAQLAADAVHADAATSASSVIATKHGKRASAQQAGQPLLLNTGAIDGELCVWQVAYRGEMLVLGFFVQCVELVVSVAVLVATSRPTMRCDCVRCVCPRAARST